MAQSLHHSVASSSRDAAAAADAELTFTADDLAQILVNIANLKTTLMNIIEPDFGLLDQLLSLQVLTRMELADIRSERTVYRRNKAFLELITSEDQCGKFLKALQRAGQRHVINFITQNGDVGAEFGDVRPLDENRMRTLTVNGVQLLDRIVADTTFLSDLAAVDCITLSQKEHLINITQPRDRNDKLLEFLTRRSVADFHKFTRVLAKDQAHLVPLLVTDGVVVGLDAELDELSVGNVVQCEDTIVFQSRALLPAGSEGQIQQELDDFNAALSRFHVQARLVVLERVHSLALYFICMTLSALLSLRDQWTSGELRDIVQSLFTFLACAEVRLKRLTWPLDEYERSLEFFGRSSQEPYLDILIQPKQHGYRFRYMCSLGSLVGEGSTYEQKVYPTVQIKNLNDLSAIIAVSCVSRDPPYYPHPHNLAGTNCKDGVCIIRLNSPQNTVNLMGVWIQCCKRTEVQDSLARRENMRVDPFATGLHPPDKIDLSVVRLCFQAFLPDVNGRFTRVIQPIVSQPIIDKKTVSELVIVRLSLKSGSVRGGDEMMILCERVKKGDVQVRFFENSLDGDVVWEAYADFNDTDVHHQYAIVFKTPAYRDTLITEPVNVFLQLHNPSTGVFSEAKPFMYLPVDPDPHGFSRKRRKTTEHTYTGFTTDAPHLPKSLALFTDESSTVPVFDGTFGGMSRAKHKRVLKEEREQTAPPLPPLQPLPPTYSFQDVGKLSVTVDSLMSGAAAPVSSLHDLPVPVMALLDETSSPPLLAADKSAFAFPSTDFAGFAFPGGGPWLKLGDTVREAKKRRTFWR